MNKSLLRPQTVWYITAALFGGFVLFFFIIGAGTAALHAQFQGRIFPGLKVGWVNLGGQTPQQAASLLADRYAYPKQGTILLQYEDKVWQATPAELGLFFSQNHNAEIAFQYGRQGSLGESIISQIQIIRHGATLPPRFVMDERVAHEYLSRVAEEIERPTLEASLRLEGLDVVVQPGQIGRTLDVEETLDALEAQLSTLQDGTVPLVVHETRPDILDVSAEAEFARQIISQPLTLTVPDASKSDPGPWVVDRQALVDMLAIERVSEGEEAYRIALDPERLRVYLKDIGKKIQREGQNARMIFNENTRHFNVLEQEVVGRSLNIEGTIQEIQKGLAEDKHQIPLILEFTRPPVTDVNTPEELGITGLVGQQTTYFYGSSAARIRNIEIAASQFHGIFVAPGETFSMGEQLGDVSLDKGYEEAWIIYGDRTIKGVGGGVCQVSTTLFRTVFFTGYPIVERHPHSYRVLYYEQTASGGINKKLAGLDATVYFPVVDFKFKNDTDHWLLMETYVNAGARRLTWKFYSTDVGRNVEWSTTGLRNIKEPPDPIYEKNKDLKKGQIKQVDWAVEGATVTVTRDVYQGGERLWRDTFKTKYMPWAAVCQYGPGTKGMPPEDPDPDNPCKPDK